MLQDLWEQLQALFGLGSYAENAGPLQIALRTVLVYVAAWRWCGSPASAS
jgi:hypothetical protein